MQEIDFEKLYKVTETLTPLKTDCGMLCDAACCRVGLYDDDMVIHLLPGEEKMLEGQEGWIRVSSEDRTDFAVPENWGDTIYYAKCSGPDHCVRSKRPLQCRSFPCWPYLDENGELFIMMMDYELPYECPLLFDPENIDPDFVQGLHAMWSELVKDPRIYDLVWNDSVNLREEGGEPYIL